MHCGPPKILVGRTTTTMHLAPPIIGKYGGQLILMKISKIGATRCQILRLKCAKFAFRWGSAPDHTGGAYSAPQNL